MASRDDIVIEITPQVLLKAYTCGIFPMAESAEDPALYWIEPQHRGILPLDKVHVPRRLARTLRTTHLQVRIDTDIAGVIEGCAASRPGRRSTWINERIRSLYRDLFDLGHCHTVEVWSGGRLVGGLYGVALNGAFFGESMFSYERDASKIALVYLAARLAHGGFRLLDTQFVTDHLRQFGTVELNREEFHRLLEKSLDVNADFKRLAPDAAPEMLDNPRVRCRGTARLAAPPCSLGDSGGNPRPLPILSTAAEPGTGPLSEKTRCDERGASSTRLQMEPRTCTCAPQFSPPPPFSPCLAGRSARKPTFPSAPPSPTR